MNTEVTHWEMLVRIALSVVLGGAIGFERQVRGRPAGLRTIMLISLGATLFTLCSVITGNMHGVDPTRIAAQIVTGVGFLGAGAIIRGQASITGLTTAAGIFAVSAVGTLVGFGAYFPAIMATAAMLVTLMGVGSLEERLRLKVPIVTFRMSGPRDKDLAEALRTALHESEVTIEQVVSRQNGDHEVLEFGARLGPDATNRLLERLRHMGLEVETHTATSVSVGWHGKSFLKRFF
ncbi:MAG TPA: MgtC/SapB family protein [Phycisphaerae bacterium]